MPDSDPADSVLLSWLGRTRADGTEFWYARDVMGLLGVTAWQDVQKLSRWVKTRSEQLHGERSEHVVERVVGNRIDFELTPLAWVLILAKFPWSTTVADHTLNYFVGRLCHGEKKPLHGETGVRVAEVEGSSTTTVSPPEDFLSIAGGDVLTVSGYLLDQGEDPDWVRRHAPVFGRRLKAEYRAARGTVPPQMEMESPEGGVWLVNQYAKEDAPLFDTVWRRFYARG